MTRCRAATIGLLVLSIAAPVAAQTAPRPEPQSRYAPPRAIQAGPQPAVRQVAGQEPVREPQGPGAASGAAQPAAPRVQPLGSAIAPIDVAPIPQPPAWIPLAPDHEKWVNQVLHYWEARSKKIKALTCEFVRWEYDPVFGPKLPDKTPDPKTPLTIAKGEIKYQEPDKGKFHVLELSRYSGPPTMPGGRPEYAPLDPIFAEHWVSDGKIVFEFDSRNKRLIQRELPPEMQGKAIADGPLPFLFGARAETIKARYWVRGLPQGGNGKYWLEAVPKSRQDAQNFKAVTIVLDEKTYLPQLLEVLAPNYDSKTNPARSTYEFSKHDVIDDSINPRELIGKLNPFTTAFYAPKLPAGWTRVMQRADGSTVVPGASGAVESTKLTPPRSPLPR
ncbi:MAG: TIGR03009 domain-containing protein [Planctomycetaceae bacterium]|nr:TIGR03009 domain-containing protein [Planctomycetaceae bacterium]